MDELLKALELVAEFDSQRPKTEECRLYYYEDGSIIGIWSSDYPTGNYIVLDNLSLFNTTNTIHLKVVDGKLIKINNKPVIKTCLVKSTTGQPVVAQHAALALLPGEEYTDIEYYDRKTNC